jgi:mRNA-degrading endonuclease HigB of HigAB toxin-antitoxin module
MELMRLFYPNHPPATISALLGDRIGVLRKTPKVEQALLSWHEEATKVEWTTPQDIKARYPTASFVGKNRVVFNIKGNDYRLFVATASELVSSISNLSASARSIRKSMPWQQWRWAGCSQESNATAAIGQEPSFVIASRGHSSGRFA